MGLKVQFGCGSNRPDGWVNHDIEADITKPLLYDNNSVDMILAEHVFEHVSPQEGVLFLDECYRILKPRGVLRLCVPVIENVRVFHARDLIFNHGHKAYYSEELLKAALYFAGFHYEQIAKTERKECDGHWRVIGEEKDNEETCRLEATK